MIKGADLLISSFGDQSLTLTRVEAIGPEDFHIMEIIFAALLR
jgi:hypothetical protein